MSTSGLLLPRGVWENPPVAFWANNLGEGTQNSQGSINAEPSKSAHTDTWGDYCPKKAGARNRARSEDFKGKLCLPHSPSQEESLRAGWALVPTGISPRPAGTHPPSCHLECGNKWRRGHWGQRTFQASVPGSPPHAESLTTHWAHLLLVTGVPITCITQNLPCLS